MQFLLFLAAEFFLAMNSCGLNAETLHKTHPSSTKRTHLFQTSILTVRKQEKRSEESINSHYSRKHFNFLDHGTKKALEHLATTKAEV